MTEYSYSKLLQGKYLKLHIAEYHRRLLFLDTLATRLGYTSKHRVASMRVCARKTENITLRALGIIKKTCKEFGVPTYPIFDKDFPNEE